MKQVMNMNGFSWVTSSRVADTEKALFPQDSGVFGSVRCLSAQRKPVREEVHMEQQVW